MIVKVCQACGEEFQLESNMYYEGWEKVFCSFLCYKNSLDIQPGKEWVNCVGCGILFKAKGSKKYCSEKCRKKTLSKKIRTNYPKTTCDVCGREFQPHTKCQQRCSPECSEQAMREYRKRSKKITYFDIFQRDGFRCQYCGKMPQDGVKLVVDHVYPVARGGKGEYHNLITACEECNLHKSDRLFPLQLVLRFWDNLQGEFSYEEAKQHWKDVTEYRHQQSRRYKKRCKKKAKAL